MEETAEEGLRLIWIAGAVIVAAAVAAGLALARDPGPKMRSFGNAGVGFGAAALVLGLQTGSVGLSIGGAVLALACGAVAVLIVMLFRSV